MGIRQKLAEEFGSTPNKAGKFGRQHIPNVTVTNIRSSKYYDDVASSIFCGVLPGDGWSGRLEDSILQGCIPVIIQVSRHSCFALKIELADCTPGICMQCCPSMYHGSFLFQT